MMRKIFGIGFHKTGTTTLGDALELLGYKVSGMRKELLPSIINNDWDKIHEYISQYDAFQDNPWPIIYQQLDEYYPNSKFIHTIRSEESWIKSIVNHCENRSSEMREHIYGFGNPKGHEDLYLKVYKAHNEQVRAYFKNRQDNYLLMSMEDGFNWDKLCTFLDKPRPNKPFPHSNKGNYSNWQKIKSQIKTKLNL